MFPFGFNEAIEVILREDERIFLLFSGGARLVLPVSPLPLPILMIIGKISGSFPHHGFAALGTVHLEAGDAALMGGLDPADWTKAEIRCPRPLAGS